MPIVGGLDIHRNQLTFDWVDKDSGRWERGRIAPADREHLARWLTQFDAGARVAFALEGCTGPYEWRYVVDEMAKVGVQPHLAEPADTAALRGPKRRAKSDRTDARHLRELLDVGMLPECYVPPDRVLEWRATLELYSDPAPHHPDAAHAAAAAGCHCPTP